MSIDDTPLTEGLQRAAILQRVRETPGWDIVVIGGGATGLGCALDAASRGHTVLLLEARDFAQGTSSRATKLIHGGVRYLAQGNLPLVREALLERARLLENAPHLVHPLRFVVPAYGWLDKPKFGIGLKLYDLLAGTHGIRPCRVLDAATTRTALPGVRSTGLRGGIAYWDAQFDDARLAVVLMRGVFDHGGVAVNYLRVTALLSEAGRVSGVEAEDSERGERFHIRARAVVNATGVWADDLRRLENPSVRPLLRPSQGTHIVVDRAFLPGRDALLVPETPDGRLLFVIPWAGKVLIGTTDTARDDRPLEPVALPGEIDFILETAARYLDPAPTRADILSVFAGLRPLISDEHASRTGQLSREHFIERSPWGMITVTGGKWTTYRRMAEETIDAVEAAVPLPRRACVTASLRLHGAEDDRARRPREADPYGSERAVVDALPGADRVLEDAADALDGSGDDRGPTEAEVRHAVRFELARGVEDVLARRHRLLFLDARRAIALAPRVAAIVAEELGRDAAWVDDEVRRFEALARGYLAPDGVG